MFKSRNMSILVYISDFRGWWRHQMTPKFQKRWNLPKIVKTNLKTFEKMYNTANLNDFWCSWLWRHKDVTVAISDRALGVFRNRISKGTMCESFIPVPSRGSLFPVTDSTICPRLNFKLKDWFTALGNRKKTSIY